MGYDTIGGLALLEEAGPRVSFAAPFGDVTVRVEQREGRAAPASCGAESEPTLLWATSLESGA